MKKARLFLLLLMAMVMPLAMFGQNTVTVNNGTATNSYVPVYGLYTDTDGTTSEFIIPPTVDGMDLLTNGTISKLTFYLSTSASVAWTATFQVYMAEVESTTLSAVVGPEACTVVYTGTLDATGTTMEINLDQPYTYQGGNLLIGTYVQTAGNYKSASFYGVAATSAGYCSYTSYSGLTNVAQNFMAKTTFTYTGGTVITCPKPTALTSANLTATTATLNWTAGGEETTWTLEYGTNEDFTGATSTTVTGTPTKELTGLTAETTYYVRVKAVCTAGTDESAWSAPTTFTTLPIPVAVGTSWSDDFETSTWTLVNGTITNAWTIGSATNNGGSKSLYISNDGGATNAYTNGSSTMVYATKLLQFEEGVYGFSYDWNANGESTYDYMRVALVPASVTLAAGTSVPSGFSTTALPTGWIALDGGSKLNLATEWQNTSVTVDVPAGNYYLTFAWRNDNSGGTNPPAAVDNINIDIVTCFAPTIDSVYDITTTTATVTWTDANETAPQAWTVRLGNVDTNVDTVVTTNTFTFNNLNPGTSYTIKVKANCAADDVSDWASVSFRTVYGIPFVEEFSTSSIPADWSRYSGLLEDVMGGTATLTSTSSGWGFGTSNGVFDSHAKVNIYGTSCKYWLVTPTIVMDDEAKLVYDVALTKYSGTLAPVVDTLQQDDKFVVLISTDTGATWTILRQYDNAGSDYVYNAIATEGQMDIIDLSSYNGQNILVAFYGESTVTSNGDNNLHIDNVQIITCLTPADVTVIDSLTTGTSATISWTEYGDPASWTILLNGEEIAANTNPYTLENLTPSTVYTVQVKANCSADDESEWSEEVLFATDCEAHVVTATNPYYEGFEQYGYCWSVAHIAGDEDEDWGVYSSDIYAYEGEGFALAPYADSVQSLLISPVIDLTQVENPVMTFYHMQPAYHDTIIDAMAVYYRTADTSAWTFLAEYTDAYEEYTLETIDLPNATAVYQVAFLSTGHDGNYVFLDEITITGDAIVEPCATPTNVAVSEENVVTWEGNAASYNVMVVVGEDTTTANVTTTTYTIEGLEDGDQGTVSVQAVCAEDNLSDWTEPVAFTYVLGGINSHNISASIYPNPTTGNVTVESNAIGADITVFDMFGKQMMTSKVANGRTELNISGFAPGIYMVRIANATGTTTVKVVKE